MSLDADGNDEPRRSQELARRLLRIYEWFHILKREKLKERRSHRGLRITLLVTVTLVVLIWLIWTVPSKLYSSVNDEPTRMSSEASTRSAIISSLAGLAAFTSLLWTAQAYRLSVRSQSTDSLFRAVERLKEKSLIDRLSGIYVMERIALDSPSDHRGVVIILGEFIKNRTRNVGGESGTIAADVQAALTVLGRLPMRESIPRADLSGVTLIDADLTALNFYAANFSNSILKGCQMERAYLINANFRRCKIDDCNFSFTFLGEADFYEARIRNSSFYAALFGKTWVLSGADLQDISLYHARQIPEDIKSAIANGKVTGISPTID